MSKIKKADLLQLVQEQADMMVKLTGMVETNKRSIIKLENEREQPQLKQLDQSVFDGLDEIFTCAAVDGNGKGFAYSHSRELRASSVYDGWVGYVHHCYLGDFDASDWENSIIERESKELTGSDLCRYLKSRKHWVLAVVSDENDATAEFHQRAVVVTDIASDGDFVCGDTVWRYAVPIDHKGEPLTASEVGL